MLTRLKSRLPLLTGGARDLPERQQTLRNAIDWSYNLLDDQAEAAVPAAGRLRRRLDAGGRRGSVQPRRRPRREVLDEMEELADNSLLKQRTTADEMRFGMLRTIREYALEHLNDSGEAMACRNVTRAICCS